MSEMVSRGSKYTDIQRVEAATQYAIRGCLAAVERQTNIPKTTLCDWKKTDWWDEIVGQLRTENQDKHIARYHQLTSESLDMALDGLKELDPKSLKANDIKALVVTGATATDKARLLLNQPTSISSNSASMSELQAQFEALAASHNRIESTVVSSQDKPESA